MQKIITIFIFSVLISQSSRAASFNCVLANTNVEKAICQIDSISTLDENMASLYSSITKIYSDTKAIKSWQKNWLSERNYCKDTRCLEDSYKRRIELLKAALTADSSTRKWTGFYSRYINKKKDPDSADIILIALDNSKIYVEGSSIWIGNVKTGNVNTGEMRGLGELRGSVLGESVKDELCSARLILTANNTLVVEGESGCGGMNVTFKGEYFK